MSESWRWSRNLCRCQSSSYGHVEWELGSALGSSRFQSLLGSDGQSEVTVAAGVSGWLFLLWADTLSFFSNFLPQMSQENWYPASASCFFMCQFNEAFCRQ
eukprot:g11702.t1